MADLPEGISPMDATILEAYAASGEVSKFREVASTLPSTPAVLAWVSDCLKFRAGPREDGTASQLSPEGTSGKTAAGSQTTPRRRAAAASQRATGAPSLPSRKHRASTPLTVDAPPKRKLRLPSRSSSPDPMASMPSLPPPREFSSASPSKDHAQEKRKDFLTSIIKGLPIATVRDRVWWATNYPDVVDAIAGDTPKWMYDIRESYDNRFKEIGPAAVRKICLDAALAHKEVEEDVLAEAPGHVIEKSLDKDEVEEMSKHFVRRANFLLKEKYKLAKFSRQDSHKKAATAIATEIEGMLDTLLKRASSKLTSSNSKKACLSTTTVLITACLAPCPPLDFMFLSVKEDHATQWSGRVRDVMRKLSDEELLQMRRTGYEDKLLFLWKRVRHYSTRVLPLDRWTIIRFEELGEKPPPEPKIWPDFEKKTVRYFAERTGGWNKAWDPVKSHDIFGNEIWV